MTPGPFDPEPPVDVPPELAEPDPDEPPPVDLWSAVGDTPPWVTVSLVLTWALVFMVLAIRHEFVYTAALLAWGANATGLGRWESAWRLLGSTFLHAGAGHVFFNAISMLVLGSAVERIFTHAGFCVLYAVGGCCASLASLAWRAWRYGSDMTFSVGASGAIFALGGALLVGAYRLRHRLAPSRARALAATLLFLVGQSLAAGVTRHGTDNVAHAAGLATGMLLACWIPMDARLDDRPPGRAMRLLGVLAALGMALALALAVRGGLWRG